MIEKKRENSSWEVWILALLAVLAYGTAIPHPFVFDDMDGIVENSAIRSVWPPWQPANSPSDTTPYGRPLVALSLAGNVMLGGLQPAGFRIVNLALHILTGWILLLLGRELAARKGIPPVVPFAAVCLWVVHPLGTNAVTYIIQRAELLMSLCYAGTLLWAARFAGSANPENQRKAWIWAVGSCAAGMLCKESMVTAPVAVLFMDRAFFAGAWREVWERRRVFHSSLLATWIVLGVCMSLWPRSQSVGFHEASLSGWQYFLMQTQVILHYFRLFVWPVGLSLDYAWPRVHSLAQALPHLVTLLGFGGLLLWLWGRRPGLAWLLGMPLLILSPTSSFVPVITSIAAEHRMYLPSAFLCGGVALGIFEAARRAGMGEEKSRRILIGGTVLLALVLLPLTLLRNADYSSAERIWKDVLRKQPNNARALTNLAVAYLNANRWPEAESLLEQAIERNHKQAEAHFNLGTLLGKTGRGQEGLKHLERAIEIRPNYADAYSNMGAIYLSAGERERARRAYEQAVAIAPESPVAHYNLAILSLEDRNLTQAEFHIQKVLRSNPRDPYARQILQEIKTRRGF